MLTTALVLFSNTLMIASSLQIRPYSENVSRFKIRQKTKPGFAPQKVFSTAESYWLVKGQRCSLP